MIIGRISGCTRELGKPVGWDDERDGKCGSLAVRDVLVDGVHPAMISAWFPSPEEVALMAAGQPVYLWVWGKGHPPVSLEVSGDR